MSNLSEKGKKILEKQIAKKVRSELDKEDFEDTAWLKAYSKANGKKDQAKVIYIDIRSQDLWDAAIENFEVEATAKAKKFQEEQITTNKDEYLRKGKLELLNRNDRINNLTSMEQVKYFDIKNRYLAFEKKPSDREREIKQHSLDRELLKMVYWEKMYKNKKPKIHKAEIEMGSDNLSSKLKKLTKLYKDGTLSKDEFEKAKDKLLK